MKTNNALKEVLVWRYFRSLQQMNFKEKRNTWSSLFFIGLLAAYFLAFKPTIALLKTNKELKGKVAQLNVSLSVNSSPTNPKNTATLINQEDFSSQKIFERISTLAKEHDLAIESFPAMHEQDLNSFKAFTQSVILEGNFKDMVQLIYELEQGAGKVQHFNCRTEKNIRTKKERLLGNLEIEYLVQQL